MSDVSNGPVSTMPGSHHKVPVGCMCDDHPSVEATHRVQGETDSFGAEFCDMCNACYEAYREELETEDTSGVCDWCKTSQPALRKTRDYDEGSSGRLYDVCVHCRAKASAEATEELLETEDDRVWFDVDDAGSGDY